MYRVPARSLSIPSHFRPRFSQRRAYTTEGVIRSGGGIYSEREKTLEDMAVKKHEQELLEKYRKQQQEEAAQQQTQGQQQAPREERPRRDYNRDFGSRRVREYLSNK
jgi:hypothetical protein